MATEGLKSKPPERMRSSIHNSQSSDKGKSRDGRDILLHEVRGRPITPPIRPSTDPLDFLPHELWTHIITLAILNEESAFDEITPHLVMVMMLVSRRWEAFLIQTPMFWTNIHIRDDLDDLHAAIAT
ncbi:14780_t:CDS:2, partial [Acaulospora colombiana]